MEITDTIINGRSCFFFAVSGSTLILTNDRIKPATPEMNEAENITQGLINGPYSKRLKVSIPSSK